MSNHKGSYPIDINDNAVLDDDDNVEEHHHHSNIVHQNAKRREEELSTQLFQSYELEYAELSESILNNLDKLRDTRIDDDFESLQRKIKRQLDAGDLIVRNMDGEISTLKRHKGLQHMRHSLDTIKREMRQRRTDYQKILQKILLDDPALDTSRGGDQQQLHRNNQYYDESDDEDYSDMNSQSNRLHESRRLLENSSDSLQSTLRIAAEIESRGHDILGNLVDQRGIIERARSRLQDTNSSLWESRRILSRMEWRNFINKCIMIVAVVVIIVVLVMYVVLQIKYKFGK